MEVDLLQQVLGLDIVAPLDVLLAEEKPRFMDPDLLQNEWSLVVHGQEWDVFRF
jgi:hypothetical protein